MVVCFVPALWPAEDHAHASQARNRSDDSSKAMPTMTAGFLLKTNNRQTQLINIKYNMS
jgi:hypothetical protein